MCVRERERERAGRRINKLLTLRRTLMRRFEKNTTRSVRCRSLWQFFCRCCFKVASVEGWQSARLIFSNFFVPVPTLFQFFCASVISNRLLKIQKKLSLFEIDAFSFTTVAAVSGLRSSTINAKKTVLESNLRPADLFYQHFLYIRVPGSALESPGSAATGLVKLKWLSIVL